MREVRRPVAHDDLLWHANARKRLALETVDVEVVGPLQEMKIEVDQCRCNVFHGGKALVEGARRGELADHRVRHRGAGSVVARELAQDFRLLKPMLVEL